MIRKLLLAATLLASAPAALAQQVAITGARVVTNTTQGVIENGTVVISNGRIELQQVRFKYGSREVIHGIDLVIHPGEMVGLVGHSGAGKTTLINLVCRFFDVADGAILIDGVNCSFSIVNGSSAPG